MLNSAEKLLKELEKLCKSRYDNVRNITDMINIRKGR